MDRVLGGEAVLLLATVISVILSLIPIFRETERTRIKLIVCGFACLAECQLSRLLIYVSQGELPSGFSIFHFGLFGFLLFMFSDHLMTDSHVDNGDRKYRKYRILPIPAVIASCALIFWCAGTDKEHFFLNVFLYLPVTPITYYCTKHLIIPDKRPKPRSFIIKYTPLEIVFFVLDIVKSGLLNLGLDTVFLILCIMEALTAIAMSVVIYTEFQGWEE